MTVDRDGFVPTTSADVWHFLSASQAERFPITRAMANDLQALGLSAAVDEFCTVCEDARQLSAYVFTVCTLFRVRCLYSHGDGLNPCDVV
jgi:hypothetical protein